MEVRAAGGLLTRRRQGQVEVLLIHRPRYDDWSFPKGKAGAGETDEDCAMREVHEETGLTCDVGPHLSDVRYRDRKNRIKVVRYFAMSPQAGAFVPNAEVDDVRWLPIDEARTLLSYEHDQAILDLLEDERPSRRS